MRLLVFLFLVCSVLAAAELHTAESVRVGLNASSALEVSGRVSRATADVLFVPSPSDGLSVESFDSTGSQLSDRVRFAWRDESGTLPFGYDAIVRVRNDGPHVRAKIPFPMNLRGFEKYLEPTQSIDSNHPAIVQTARMLAKDEDDLFLFVSKVAAWVKREVEYNLSTLTADVSKPASWVLQNRVGVCDELTSLFIALLRSAGVPARFVSGVAFTNAPQFPGGWGAHGWAEVYFPGVGWVPYDPTFGQLAWVDPGHVKLKDSFDPKESTMRVEWVGDADVVVRDLKLDARLLEASGTFAAALRWSVGSIHSHVGFGSSNVVVIDVENMRDYYVADEFSLADVNELEPIEGSQVVMLRPRERRRFYWPVRVRSDLDRGFQYEIPLLVRNSHNESQRSSFVVTKWDVVYSMAEAANYIAQQQKSTVEPVELACILESDVVLPNESTSVRCRVDNHLDDELDAQVCYGVCKDVMVLPKSSVEVSFPVDSAKVGPNEVRVWLVSAGAKNTTADSRLTLVQLDQPQIAIAHVSLPEEVARDEVFELSFVVQKQSVAHPRNVTVQVRGAGALVVLPLGDLSLDQEVVVNIDAEQVYGAAPRFSIDVDYSDERGAQYSVSSAAQTRIANVPWYSAVVGWFLSLFGR